MASETFGFDDLDRSLHRARRHTGDTRALSRRLGALGVSQTVRRIKENRTGQQNAPVTKAVKQGSTPLQDSGAFQQGITYRATQTAASYGSNARQARLLQEGGTITAKRADKLAFPASKKTRRLMRRYGSTPRRCIKKMRKSGDWKVWVTDGAIMAQKRGKLGFRRTKAFVLFIRKEKVTIPAYRPFRIDRRDADEIQTLLDQWVAEGFE